MWKLIKEGKYNFLWFFFDSLILWIKQHVLKDCFLFEVVSNFFSFVFNGLFVYAFFFFLFVCISICLYLSDYGKMEIEETCYSVFITLILSTLDHIFGGDTDEIEIKFQSVDS